MLVLLRSDQQILFLLCIVQYCFVLYCIEYRLRSTVNRREHRSLVPPLRFSPLLSLLSCAAIARGRARRPDPRARQEDPRPRGQRGRARRARASDPQTCALPAPPRSPSSSSETQSTESTVKLSRGKALLIHSSIAHCLTQSFRALCFLDILLFSVAR